MAEEYLQTEFNLWKLINKCVKHKNLFY
jgi:hypothetical protein